MLRPSAPVSLLALVVCACSARFAPATFDLEAARRPDAVTFGPRRDAGHGITLEDVTFLSTEWTAQGVARPIRIRAVLARPTWAGKRPAVLVAHGLGAKAEPDVTPTNMPSSVASLLLQ